MDLAGWNPVSSRRLDGEFVVDWEFTGELRFTDSFFSDTLTRARIAHRGQQQTTLAQAADWLETHPGLEPSGFIFHMTRCGSTLAARMLAALPGNRVLSEPTALDPLLIDPAIPRADRLRWLRTLVGILGCPLPGESQYFIKLDCWHVLDLPLFVEAFPRTPWIFLYRKPAEVLVSQIKQPGYWTVPSLFDPRYFGVVPDECFRLGRVEYVAHALSQICAAALEHRHCGRGMLVNYNRLPDFVVRGLTGHFQLNWSGEDLSLMAQAAMRDAKHVHAPFSPDSEAKCREVTPEIRAAVDGRLAAMFATMEAADTCHVG
jgi:hypothetical protein